MRPLLDDGFILTGATGVVTDLAQNLQEVRARDPEYDGLRNHDQTVRLHGDAAIVTGITAVKGRSGGASFDRNLRFTDTRGRRDGRWLLASSHASAVPQR
ncbi:MAG: nuclear transport factor 2 family protein [Luteimonas sp.]